jgi:DNA-binding transcriptional LysR family regulator
MTENALNDLAAFLAVARERSFTRAAAQIGVSQSALSQTVRALEGRLGVRLLTRTTRSVATTDAGERLFTSVAPRIEEIRAELAALSGSAEKPVGSVRISADEHAATMVLWPALQKLLPRYPGINVEIAINNGLVDIVAERCDAGVRSGDIVDRDMIAVPIGPDIRMIVVGSPAFFSSHLKPAKPQDLTAYPCINLRLPTRGGLYAWEFKTAGREIRVRVAGQLIFNSIGLMLNAALSGFGLAYLAEDQVRPYLESGQLVQVLAEFCPAFSGHHLYYPSRRQPSSAFAILVDALRYRESAKRVHAG